MKQLEDKIAEVAQSAARIMDANGDGNITFADAKYKAASIGGKTAAWVDEHDDMFERPYNKAMRSIKISKWPLHSAWGWLFKWPMAVFTWSLIIILLVWALMPPTRVNAVGHYNLLRSEISDIRRSLARLEGIAPQIAVMEARSLEAMQTIADLKAFTQRVERTKLFRKSSVGKSWKLNAFGK